MEAFEQLEDVKIMMDIINKSVRLKNSKYLKSRGIKLPTYAHMKNPIQLPDHTKELMCKLSVHAIHPLNLYRITWKNSLAEDGFVFKQLPDYIEFPPELTGVKSRIVGISGRSFPTGAHKVGSSLACLMPKIISGEFDIENNHAIWPSTGNFCRGGAFNSAILGCHSVAVLPENMSKERFDWLCGIAGEVIKTKGSESNVKEIYDKVKQLQQERSQAIVFNQFMEKWNYFWHYDVTGNAIMELFESLKGDYGRFAGVCLSSGSAGTLGCADAIKQVYPSAKLAVGEALQCPTLLMNGYGEHGIEGIGDKHVPWIHNVKNTDMVIGIDQDNCLQTFKLFNMTEGKKYLSTLGMDDKFINMLEWCGISGVGNLIASIKFSKYYELKENDIVFTVLTDSSDLYKSKLDADDAYRFTDAQKTFYTHLMSLKTDYVEELSYRDKRKIHNLKYFTWVEQQGFDIDELDAQWYDSNYWEKIQSHRKNIDVEIEQFNNLTN